MNIVCILAFSFLPIPRRPVNKVKIEIYNSCNLLIKFQLFIHFINIILPVRMLSTNEKRNTWIRYLDSILPTQCKQFIRFSLALFLCLCFFVGHTCTPTAYIMIQNILVYKKLLDRRIAFLSRQFIFLCYVRRKNDFPHQLIN